MTETPLDAALTYAAYGWCVLPIRAGGKAPAISNWTEAATTDPEVIRGWWQTWPDAGVGILTGPRSGIWVLDVDGQLGADSLADLEREHGPLPATPLSLTGSGGRHYVFALPPGLVIRNSASAIAPGLDVRAEGGQIVAPPTIHPNGQPYAWELSAPETPVRAPQWLTDLVKEPEAPEGGAEYPQAPQEVLAASPFAWDRYNGHASTDDTVAMLIDAGWHTPRYQRDGHVTLVRPGKAERDGIGGTVGYVAPGVFHCFTSSAPPFVAEETYSPAAVYAAVHHGGDHAAADRALVDAGWGAFSRWTDEEMRAGMAAYAAEANELARMAGAGVRFPVIGGGDFLHDYGGDVQSLWGDGHGVLWAKGEGLMITGPQGVGKTTLAHQLLAARIGADPYRNVLGRSVAPGERVLYLASDRPTQIGRAMGRLMGETDRRYMNDRLKVWPGPPPAPIDKHPELLAEMACEHGCDTVFIDSLKDMATGLASDEVASGVNIAFQTVIASGLELVVLHHQRKKVAGEGRPKSLEDVYGGIFVTAGMGSVLLVWGVPGDACVELNHLKQPLDEVGPLKIVHDHDRGISRVDSGDWDPLAYLHNCGPNGCTVEEAARAKTGKSAPEANDVEAARRALDRLVESGHATRRGGGRGRGNKAHYTATEVLN